MDEAALTVSFSNPSAVSAAGDCLKIEQKPWGKDVGKTSNMQAIHGIAAAVNGGRWPDMYCGGLNGVFVGTVYAYPCDPYLIYQFKVSHGLVTSKMVEVAVREEIIQCSMQLEHATDYPVLSMLAQAWIGHCYDHNGNITGRPVVTEIDNKIVFDQEVYGSLRVQYQVLRHVYRVTVSKRLSSIENNYQSIAYAVWNGGVIWIDIEAPANFEAFDGDCGNGAWYDGDGNLIDLSPRGSMCVNDKTKIPVAVTADKNVTMDYCNQEEIESVISETVDYEEIWDECHKND